MPTVGTIQKFLNPEGLAVHPIDLICAKNAGHGAGTIEPQLAEPDIPGIENSQCPFLANSGI